MELNERILPDDYPVFFNYLYVCDGKVIQSDIQGTVLDLKKDLKKHYKLKADQITNCDVDGRYHQLNK